MGPPQGNPWRGPRPGDRLQRIPPWDPLNGTTSRIQREGEPLASLVDVDFKKSHGGGPLEVDPCVFLW